MLFIQTVCIHTHTYANLCNFDSIVTYATSEELRDALDNSNQDFDQPRKLMLDVITSNKKSTKPRPVLLHVHGGAWRGGRKDIFYPYEKLLVSEDDWVQIKKRLSLLFLNFFIDHCQYWIPSGTKECIS